MDQSLDTFVNSIVPDLIEELVGQVSRKLKKEYEYFNIEQQKEAKREAKIIANANHHIQNTAQNFTDEEALLSACFYNLQDDVLDTERRAARMYDRKRSICAKSIVHLKEEKEAISFTRAQEDADLLDTVIDTQQLLQRTILEHFGMSGGDDNGGPVAFDKLENRMARKNSRDISRQASKDDSEEKRR